MKRNLFVCLAAMGIAALAGFVAEAAPLGTNVWCGAASGGDWSDPANWTAVNSTYTAEELLALDCAYDIRSLADGAQLTNKINKLRIAGLITKANQGTITLLGSDFYLMGAPVLEFGQNTTVVCKMNHPNDWNNVEGSGKIVLAGAGTLRLEPTSSFSTYLRQLQPCHTMTLVLGSNCWLNLTYLVQWNNSTVRLENNVTVGYLYAGHDECSVDLNGYNLYVCGGEQSVPNLYNYRGTVKGTGSITHSGGWTGEIYSKLNYTGWLALYTGDFNFHAGSTLAETVRLIADGPGRFIFPDSQTLADYSGSGAVGGVQLPDNATLTLTGASGTSKTSAGRIYGNTDVVKRGAGYEQVFTGDNAYTGSTTVAEGTLTLRRPTCRPGLVAHWTFDNPDDLGRDFGPNGYTLSKVNMTVPGVVTQAVSGVAHRPALEIGPNAEGHGASYFSVSQLTRTKGFPTGNDPISVSMWIRPMASPPDTSYFFRLGNWGGNGTQLVLWQRSATKLETCIVNWSTSDGPNSPIITCPGLSDGNWHHVAVTYADNTLKMYYDGELKSTKTTTYALALPSSCQMVLGNNDSAGAHNGVANAGLTHRYYGGIDDVCIWNRVLTDEEVAAEHAMSRPAVADSATVLPEPLCHWAFDDASDLGKDTMGRATLLPNLSAGSSTRAGSYGRYLTGSMKLPAADFPENFPTGNASFTVSMRVLPCGPPQTYNLLAWGDTSVATNRFRLYMDNCPRRAYVTCGTQSARPFNWSQNYATERGCWTHIVVVCDTQSKIMRLIRDGKVETTYTGFDANITAQDLYINCNTAGTANSGHYIDDVRIYDRALTMDETLTLSRSLEKGTVGPVIPDNSDVSVSAGATLKVEGEGHAVKSLTGAGDLFLNGPTTFDPGIATNFTGTVRGTGTLRLASPVAATTVYVEIPAGAELAGEALPLVSTSGTLFVPSSGCVTFASRPTMKRVVIASGAQAESKDGLAGWTTSLMPAAWKTTFSLEDGVFVVNIVPRGCTLILR